LGLLDKLFGSSGKSKVNIEKRFRLHNRLGQGSMSKTWRATDMKSGREVCLKVLDKEKTDALLKRFVGKKRPSEGEVAMSLDHPNIVRTFEFGDTTKNEQYLVMELVHGSGLNFLVDTKSKQLQGNELNLLIQTGEALAHFHKMRYIHRDICPRNVMVTPDNVAKLIDFGLAVPNTPEFRQPGNRTGTASYMAPELIRRSVTDERIDVFSFGVLAYNVFTGTLPWEAAESLQAMLQHLNSPGRDPREFTPDLSEELVEVLMRGIERDPNVRYKSMNVFVTALRQLAGESLVEG